MSRDLFIIMAKYPTRGKVKTRLAAEIGHRAATELYRSFLDHFVREFEDAPFDVEWRSTPAGAPFRWLVAAAVPCGGNQGKRPPGTAATTPFVRPQPDGDLGTRMREIFRQSFARGYRRVVMIGTDAPEVGKKSVRRTLKLLQSQRAVFQPTHDGGYALVGLSRMLDIFSGMPWSTDKLMDASRRRLREFNIAFAELPPTFDVDTAADLARWKV